MFSAMRLINGDSKRAEMRRFMALEILRLESTVRQLANWINPAAVSLARQFSRDQRTFRPASRHALRYNGRSHQ